MLKEAEEQKAWKKARHPPARHKQIQHQQIQHKQSKSKKKHPRQGRGLWVGTPPNETPKATKDNEPTLQPEVALEPPRGASTGTGGGHKALFGNKPKLSAGARPDPTARASFRVPKGPDPLLAPLPATSSLAPERPRRLANPTAGPTGGPTADPTADPTVDPTANPRADPTAIPTVDPVADPMADPRADPRAGSTVDPVADPVADLTADPISDPTAEIQEALKAFGVALR